MTPGLWRNVGLSIASAIAGGVAVIGFAASNSVDLYAIFNQLNVVIAETTKLVAVATPLVMAGIVAWKSTRKVQVADVAAVPGTVVKIPEQAIADALPSNVKGPNDPIIT